ncbi:hypothetical protein [Endozoicomonas sp. ONNA2]|uniref:hypothetical protein n=1 Tax=Endozoicomonas sp. ONNA2 TaxID=2828741 RepID=UPI00214907BC|nr:hypothetical protein [Endozoicomonas sp. ONNA2]
MIVTTDVSHMGLVASSDEKTGSGRSAGKSIFSKSVSIPPNSTPINLIFSTRDSTGLPGDRLNERVAMSLRNDSMVLAPDYLRAVNKLASTLQAQFDANELTSGFPVRELYRLFIDKKDWQSERVFFAYENEPGYTRAMLTVFVELKNIFADGVLNSEKITKIHDLSIQDVCSKKGGPIPNGDNVYGSVNLYFNETGLANCTSNGFREIVELVNDKDGIKITNYKPMYDDTDNEIPGEIDSPHFEYYEIGKCINIARIYHSIPSNRKNIKIYCNKYNKQICDIKNTVKSEAVLRQHVITSIAEVCRNIQVTHPFEDGNARSFGCLLVNGLLMTEGMSPAIIPDANVFDGHSVDELVEIIKEGQQQFQSLRLTKISKGC